MPICYKSTLLKLYYARFSCKWSVLQQLSKVYLKHRWFNKSMHQFLPNVIYWNFILCYTFSTFSFDKSNITFVRNCLFYILPKSQDTFSTTLYTIIYLWRRVYLQDTPRDTPPPHPPTPLILYRNKQISIH